MNKKTIILQILLALISLILWMLFLFFGYLLLVGIEFSGGVGEVTPYLALSIASLVSILFAAVCTSVKVRYRTKLTKTTLISLVLFTGLFGYRLFLMSTN